MAGALGVRLGGRNVYGSDVEDRPFLGEGSRPRTADITRAVRLSQAVWLAAAALAVSACLAWPGRPA